MGYKNLQQAVRDLEKTGQLKRIEAEVHPHLEAAEIHRRVQEANGPALLFENVSNTNFPMLSNLYGTRERIQFLFRDTLPSLKHLFACKADPLYPIKNLSCLPSLARSALNLLPRSVSDGPVFEQATTLDALPAQVSWPEDGGAFFTLPVVHTEDPRKQGLMASNLGMYRCQFTGGQYTPNKEMGLHYQLHRGIGIHHTIAQRERRPLKVNVYLGGPPALALAGIMPLPEGLPELAFASVLAGHRLDRIERDHSLPVVAEADFCITGTVDLDKRLPEGPFGDHLGYYSLAHPFPVLKVQSVHHRLDALFPFTVVGRPPQEDSQFGAFIHELVGDLIPSVLPGVKEVHAVDEAGVHPLLLAVGSERYTPYEEGQSRPQELLTQANAILGQGQMSLAKYLLIANEADAPPSTSQTEKFFNHVLCRVDWRRDCHFQTETTIDTLDYSGTALNEGSKVVIAARGPARRQLPTAPPENLDSPQGIKKLAVVSAGILALEVEPDFDIRNLEALPESHPINSWPLLTLVDDATFVGKDFSHFVWVTFTRSNPSHDITGIQPFTDNKHWGCRGSLIIDARIKDHHAPVLEPDPNVTQKVDERARPSGDLYGLF